jgi:glutamate-5-semialdehyde dehydrogenase
MTLLESLPRGTRLLYGGNRLAPVPDAVADAFRSGDRLTIVDSTGDVLHVPAAIYADVAADVSAARDAFERLPALPDTAIDRFYDLFAARLADESTWAHIRTANESDVRAARERGRSTSRLVADTKMRARMIEGLKLWREMPSRREAVVEAVDHDGWQVEQVVAGLGVIGFVFEGRPNVFADATGVLRSGNTTVMRIGRDALGTARAISQHALRPALREAGLPEGCVVLVERAEHAAAWALFSNPGIALAVARGSGAAVAQLGAIARQHGTPVSLPGTGGAWIVADESAPADALELAVYHSLDSKKCNTLNTFCVVERAAETLMPLALAGIERRGRELGHGHKLRVTAEAQRYVPEGLFERATKVLRAEGEVEEPLAERITADQLGIEWEWEGTPEVSLHVVPDVDDAVTLFNRHSPHFVASLISTDDAVHQRFFRAVDAPFVGNGFTRWVDGQFALNRPELGLSSWQFGRLFARSGLLTGDGVYTVRLRATQTDPNVHA